jgi:hypothetical protein
MVRSSMPSVPPDEQFESLLDERAELYDDSAAGRDPRDAAALNTLGRIIYFNITNEDTM